MSGRETGSKVVDGKVVPPENLAGSVPVDSLPELGSPSGKPQSNPLKDGRLSVEPVYNGILVKVQPATVLNANMRPEALLQAFNKLNQWVTINEISPQGGKRVLQPPKEADPSQEYTAVRLMEGTCQVSFRGNDEGGEDGR